MAKKRQSRRPKPLLPEAPESKKASATGPVECLGRTFASEDERRSHYLARLRALLPELRKRPDFPKGSDEAILRLSDPPWYTACPNPFLDEFVEHYGRPYDPDEPYHREPLAVDVSVGKTDALYRAHGYHTKVPHLAIVPSILHYTKPGDLVLDGFCGSGMTGVAAQWCETAPPEYRQKLEAEWKEAGREPPKWGARRAILGDLSPAATFIAANYNIPFDVEEFAEAAQKLLDDVEDEIGWMYETRHTDGTMGQINYTVWSEVFTCHECGHESIFLNEAMDSETKSIRKVITCRGCDAQATKEKMDLQFETRFDDVSGLFHRSPRRLPVLINYSVGKLRFEKVLGSSDKRLLERIAALPPPVEVPTVAMPDCQMTRVGRMRTTNTTAVRHMFLPRAALSFATAWRRADEIPDTRLRSVLLFLVEQATWGMSILNRFSPTHYSQVNRYMSGVLYVSSHVAEVAPSYILRGKTSRLRSVFGRTRFAGKNTAISANTASAISVPDGSVDYIFTDPPFGENLYYADLNYLVESWHGIFTRVQPEAIVDRRRGKALFNYHRLMEQCFRECSRVLKPGRWMTVVFHNSKNAVWNAIQDAIQAAGFVVADVHLLDKQQRSFRQVTTNAVKKDLVISAYKPNGGLEERFRLNAGTEEGAWDFVDSHLRQLPVFAERDGRSEVMQERQDFLLYNRMVAFHVERSADVPLSAAEFFSGLRGRYAERDGMFFLSEQLARYDARRFRARGLFEPAVTVRDEETAIRWLRSELKRKPQTFQELHPNFMREIGGWLRHEAQLELKLLLDENFMCYDSSSTVRGRFRAWRALNWQQ